MKKECFFYNNFFKLENSNCFMFKEEKIFENELGEILQKSELLQILQTFYHNKFKKFPGVFMKRGEDYRFKGLEFLISPIFSDDSTLCKINYSEFAKDALREIDRYRILTEGVNSGDIYEEVKIAPESMKMGVYKIEEDGDYLLALKGEPNFKVSVTDAHRRCLVKSVRISSIDDKEFLNYLPSIEEELHTPSKVKIDVSTNYKRDNLIYQVYKKVLEHHKKTNQ